MNYNRTFYLNSCGKIHTIYDPQVWGILNITTDSFYDGGKYIDIHQIIPHVQRMLDEGAAAIDIGAMSSRPGAAISQPKEELDTLTPIIRALKKEFTNVLFSIDTVHSDVARAMIDLGVDFINDISGGQFDNKMMDVVAEMNVPYVMMHMRGTPNIMQKNVDYDNVALDIFAYFKERINLAREKGIKDIIIDPGFGFSKNIEQNFELITEMELFKNFKLPMMVGISRKSFIYKSLGCQPEDALNGTSVMHMIALQHGADILRVHDVKEAVEVVELFQKFKY